ncbi:MAG TPA: extracellular solute-binding protein [Anaerolineae bacterium]|nr:extracellular solute-binding protein [Anaerolineae bacterium]
MVASLVLTACPAPTAAPPAVEKATEAPTVAKGPEEVTIVAWTIGPDDPSFYRAKNLEAAAERLNKKLEAEGANVRVKVEATFDTTSWGDYKKRVLLAFEGKKAPDIVLSGHEDIAPWADAGYILSLDDYIAKYPDTYNDIFETLWGAVTFRGKRWAIPQDTEARPMYFNKTRLKELGWSDEEVDALPEKIKNGEFTLYDMLEVAKEAQDKGVVQPGYGYWHRPKKGSDFYHFYYNCGGTLQDPESGKLVLDKKAAQCVYQFFWDATQEYKVTKTDLIGTEWKIIHETVAGGKALFFNGGTWNWAEWRDKYLPGEADPEAYLWENIGFALIPAMKKGGKPNTLSHPLVYMVTAQSKHPDLAFRIITEATAPDLNALHAVQSGHLAILKSELQDPKYAEDKFAQAAAYMLEYTTFLPNNPDFGTLDEIYFGGISAVESGQWTPEEAVENVVADVQVELGDKVIIKE